MGWTKVYFGKITKEEIVEYCINDSSWQAIRLSMKGKSLKFKYDTLFAWLGLNDYSRASQVQATNYTTALSRGGLIKPEDYRR